MLKFGPSMWPALFNRSKFGLSMWPAFFNSSKFGPSMRPAFFNGSKFGLSMCPKSHPKFHFACDFLVKLSPEVIAVCRFVTNVSHSDCHQKNRGTQGRWHAWVQNVTLKTPVPTGCQGGAAVVLKKVKNKKGIGGRSPGLLAILALAISSWSARAIQTIQSPKTQN
jgi:hypothetical protein